MAKSDEEQITITRSQLKEIIANEMKALSPQAMSEDDKFHAEIAQRKGTDKPPLPTKIIPGVRSPQTGSMFNAKIDHRGIVVGLNDYKYPDGTEKREDDGGICPNGYTPGSPLHKQWMYDNFWNADLNTFVGKPLPGSP